MSRHLLTGFTLAALLLPRIDAQIVQNEPNDSISTATPSTLAAGASGGVFSIGNNGDGPFGPTTGDGSGDFDFFSIEADAGQTIIFDIRSEILGSGLDTLIGLYNSAGVLVESNDDDGVSRDSFIRYSTSTADTYYAVVGNWVPGSANAAGSLPTDPNTPGTGRGAPGGQIGQYEVALLLDGAVYLTHDRPTFPLSIPGEPVNGTLTLTNEGSAAATVTGLDFAGPGASAYSVSNPVPFDIPSGGSTTLDLTFDADGSTATQEAALKVVSNDVVRPTLEIPFDERAVAGLLLHLAFDDPPGTQTGILGAPADISGNGFRAAYVVNAGAPNFGFGRPPLAGSEGASVMFNDAGSSGNYVLTSNDFPHTATVSYSFWIRPTAGSGEDTLFNRDPNFGQGDAIYGSNLSTSGAVNFRIAGQEMAVSEAGAVPDDSTHHIVVTHLDSTGFGDGEADRTRLYIDGELVSENSETLEFPEYSGGTNSRLWIGTRSAAGTGFNGDMDDFQLYNIELTSDEVARLFQNPGSTLAPPPRFPIDLARDGSHLVIEWDSSDGKLYNLRSETDPAATEPIAWPIYDDNSDIAATPPRNTLSIALPSEPLRFFVVEEFDAPPTVIYSENFDSGQGAWTTGSDGEAGTEWQIGSPSNVGPSAAKSAPSCFGTNLDADYEVNADVWLLSPAIDLTTASAATLNYSRFVNVENVFDSGQITVLDALDDSELGVVESSIDGERTDWDDVSRAIPEAALGRTIKLEFRFQSDDFGNFAGWYIDDVTVTVP